jgi:hypothetical protein
VTTVFEFNLLGTKFFQASYNHFFTFKYLTLLKDGFGAANYKNPDFKKLKVIHYFIDTMLLVY